MALLNYTLPFGNMNGINWAATATVSPIQQVTAVNDLLYGPTGHEETNYYPNNEQRYHKNNPYAPPATQFQYKNRNYLPPILSSVNPIDDSQSNNYQQTPKYGTASFRSSNYQTIQQTTQTYDTLNYEPRHHSNQEVPQPPSRPNLSIHEIRHQQQQYRQNQKQQQHQQENQSENIEQQQQQQQQPQQGDYNNNFSAENLGHTISPLSIEQQSLREQPSSSSSELDNGLNIIHSHIDHIDEFSNIENKVSENQRNHVNYDDRGSIGYTQVNSGRGSKTQLHAVLDYDAEQDDYYDENSLVDNNTVDAKSFEMPSVTPLQGPIFLKNGSVPVVPLFSYPTLNNGSFIQIPIWWTALSVALGLELRGDIIKGTPCVKRFNQLFCPTAGNMYPIDRIETFIDENKALMRRMYGDFTMSPKRGPTQRSKRRKKHLNDFDLNLPGVPDIIGPLDLNQDHQPIEVGDSYFAKWRSRRQTQQSFNRLNQQRGTGNTNTAKSNKNNSNDKADNTEETNYPNLGSTFRNEPNTGRIDACESKIEIVTPYWASNSAGKIRAIVNTQHFEQAIHQEVCVKMRTSRCGGDCGCEQKYKWHRLLAYDPDNDCKGIFMDWFLFPSCCVCRCNPI